MDKQHVTTLKVVGVLRIFSVARNLSQEEVVILCAVFSLGPSGPRHNGQRRSASTKLLYSYRGTRMIGLKSSSCMSHPWGTDNGIHDDRELHGRILDRNECPGGDEELVPGDGAGQRLPTLICSRRVSANASQRGPTMRPKGPSKQVCNKPERAEHA